MEKVLVVRYEKEGSVCEVSVYDWGSVLRFRIPCWFLDARADEVVFLDSRVILRYYAFGSDCDAEEVELWLSTSTEVEYGDMKRLGDILRKYDVERVEVRAYMMSEVGERTKVDEGLERFFELPF